MIDNVTFSLDWVKQVNEKQNWKRKGDQFKNLEKAIMALKLLEDLKMAGINFVFKGGTSLLLILNKMYRLSVDIDLIIESNEEYVSHFDAICGGVFTHWRAQPRDNDATTKTKHYQFYYKPFVDTNDEASILLDVYEGRALYDQCQEVELDSPILSQSGVKVHITVPTIDCILADKLTAFAPHTIGIKLSAEPGKRPKRVEVLKQMFDIANLFDVCTDLETIRETYKRIAQEEIELEGLTCTYKETLQDSLDFALMIGFAGKKCREEFEVLSKGYNDFSKFVVDLDFNEENAVRCASKVAYLTASLLYGEAIEKYEDDMDLLQYPIKKKEYKEFSDYLYSNPEAYYYYAKAIAILS